MIRILQSSVANAKGGLTHYICQNYINLNKTLLQFDFITHDKKLSFENDFIKSGAKFYRLPRSRNFISYILALKKLKKEHRIMHIHLAYNNPLPILATKIVGFDKIILHAHANGFEETKFIQRTLKKILHNVGKILSPYLVTNFLACSDISAKWMFSNSIFKNKRYEIAKNAIDLDKFAYNEIIQKQKRDELNIADDCFVIGHVGRFCYPKNHKFILEIFNEIVKKNPNSKLLLVGGYIEKDRHIFENTQNLVKNFNLENKVIFLGKRDDISELYQAMDCFVFPSIFEGFGMVALEAQASGLPTFISDCLSKELVISNLANFVSLQKKPDFWAEEILKTKEQKRFSPIKEIRKAGYDIKEEIKNIEKFYKGILEK